MNTSTPPAGFRCAIASAILAALGLGFSAVSAADPASASVTVKYTDLNIASPSGALSLYERIREAAKSACSYYWFKTDADEARCVHNTIADAVDKVNEPALSAVYDAKNSTPTPTPLVSQSHWRVGR